MGPHLDELRELLTIPSISARKEHADDVERAAAWVADYLRPVAHVRIVPGQEHPVVRARLPASTQAADTPTVLLYAHFDVQPVEPLDAWTTPPFEPDVRDGWLYARGAADAKANLLILIAAARELAEDGALPVNVEIVADGEEEIGGVGALRALDEITVDAAIVYDWNLDADGHPIFFLSTRGIIDVRISVTTADRDLHSGAYGGVALNAAHALMTVLTAPQAQLDELAVGALEADAVERSRWDADRLRGPELLADSGARPRDGRATAEYFWRTGLRPSFDVHSIACGEVGVHKTIIPSRAGALASLRLAPGQDPDVVAPLLFAAITRAAPEGADVLVEYAGAVSWPAALPADSTLTRLVGEAFSAVIGTSAVTARGGFTIPILGELAQRGVPTLLTGFGAPTGGMHAPDERFPVDHIELGIAATKAALTRLEHLRA